MFPVKLRNASGGNYGNSAERFPLGNIRQMNFHCRNLNGFNGIVDGIRIVGISTRIDYDTLIMVDGLVQEVDNRTLMIGLNNFIGKTPFSA